MNVMMPSSLMLMMIMLAMVMLCLYCVVHKSRYYTFFLNFRMSRRCVRTMKRRREGMREGGEWTRASTTTKTLNEWTSGRETEWKIHSISIDGSNFSSAFIAPDFVLFLFYRRSFAVTVVVAKIVVIACHVIVSLYRHSSLVTRHSPLNHIHLVYFCIFVLFIRFDSAK